MKRNNRYHYETFDTISEAWAFTRLCDSTGRIAGYPSLSAPYTVQYKGGRISPKGESLENWVVNGD